MDIVLRLIGLLLILVTLREVFHMLFHPSDQGTQYPSTFFFAAPGRTFSPAHGLPFLTALARADGMTDESRPAATQLATSLDLFAATIAEQHLSMPGAETDAIFKTYRRRHQGPDDTEPIG